MTYPSTPPPPPPPPSSDPPPWSANHNVCMICPYCREYPADLIEEFSSGDMVCGSCGLVLGDRIVDTRSEWRTFSDDSNSADPSRVGDASNPLLNGPQLSTTIAFVPGNAGRELQRAHNKSSHDKSTKTLLAAYKEIGAFCDSINIQKIVSDAAKQLFKITDDHKAFRGKPQEAIIAGCIFIACRQCQVPRTFREIFALTKVPKKEIGRVFKALEKFFATQDSKKIEAITKSGGTVDDSQQYKTTSSTQAHDLMIRFCNNLNLGQQCTTICQELASRAAELGTLAGRSPISSAAACIYMVSFLMQQGKTAKVISAVAGVSDGTIRNAYKHLYNDREKLIDPEWVKDGKGDIRRLPLC